MSNNFLTHLNLGNKNIEGPDGGRLVGLLLQHFRQLKILDLALNRLGPLGARALAPGLAAARHLESLHLFGCGLGNDGVANLIPDGQVNRTLTNLDLRQNDIYGFVGEENVFALVIGVSLHQP
jgi:Ran GTPase-activating protein (RanGAP) involved in mRNA processing and transport